MKLEQHTYLAAANYSCGAYGAGTYSSSQACATGGSASGGSLADTGYDVIIPAALGLAILGAGVLLLVKKFARKR